MQDFIAAVAAQARNHRQRPVSYYGGHSKKMRGAIKDGAGSKATECRANFRQTWAMLIQRIFEVDLLE